MTGATAGGTALDGQVHRSKRPGLLRALRKAFARIDYINGGALLVLIRSPRHRISPRLADQLFRREVIDCNDVGYRLIGRLQLGKFILADEVPFPCLSTH